MKMAYTNKYGDKVYENVEPFEFRGTIMSASIEKVGACTLHRLYVEDAEGGKHVTVWDNAKGYDREKLKVGYSVRFSGIIRKNNYYDSEGKVRTYKEYKAQSIL